MKAPGHDPIAEFRKHFKELEHHMREVQKELEDLQNLSTRLLDVGVAISSEIDLFSLLSRIIDEAKNLLKAQKGTLYLVDKETNEIYFHVVESENLKEIRLPINEKSIAGYVTLMGVPLNIGDVYTIPEEEPYSFNKSIDRKTGLRTRSMLTVPMIGHDGTVSGAVQLLNKVDDYQVVPFSVRDEKILMSLASQAAVAIENATLYKEIADLFESVVRFSASAIDERDPATAGHSRRVAMYALALAKALDCFSEEEIEELEYAAWMHDVGKIGVRENILMKENKLFPDEFEKIRERFEGIKLSIISTNLNMMNKAGDKKNIAGFVDSVEEKIKEKITEVEDDFRFIERINKPGFLSPEEKNHLERIGKKTFKTAAGKRRKYLYAEEMKKLRVPRGNLTESERKVMNAHVESSFKILSRIPFSRRLKNVPGIAVLHHERLDGSGYPKGLKDDQINMQGRILALVDVYDALTAQDRPYKPAIPVERSLKILEEEVNAGRLDRKVFDTFVNEKIYELEDPGYSD